MHHVHRSLITGSLLVVVASAGPLEAQRRPEQQDYDRAHRMLQLMVRDLREHYYDSTFRGADLTARARAYDARIDSLPSVSQMMAHLAQFVSDLNDSHTWFNPPELAGRINYGFGYQMIGDTCYITGVQEGSDAETKGLRAGDRLLFFDAILPTRQNLRLISYVYNQLSPRPQVHIVAQGVDGTRKEVDVRSRIVRRQRILDLSTWDAIQRWLNEQEFDAIPVNFADFFHHAVSMGDTVMIWRMRFFCCSQDIVDHRMNQARDHRALILDLRDNGGGAENMMLRLLGHLFDRPVTIGSQRWRDSTNAVVVRPVGREPFRGMLVILISSNSASSSEVVAKATQLEERAIIVGDRSAGATMLSQFYPHMVGGTDRGLEWALQVTVADFIMADGSRIERVGVTPHELVLRTAEDIAAHNDPELARALEIVGVRRTPAEAGQIYPPDPRPRRERN